MICRQEFSFPEFAKIMHEIRIAADLSDIVLEAARQGGLVKVTRVNVTFGQMVQIVPEIFKPAFIFAVGNTIARDAEINIEVVPVKLRCKSCGSGFEPGDNLFACNDCGSAETEIENGKELYVKSIEGE